MLNNKLKKNSIIKRAILFCIIALTLFSAFFTSFCATGVFAEEQKLSYDTTDVLFDLNDFKDVSEADFDTTPYEQYKDIRLIRFIEYGFNTFDFGLYCYVYNPKNINIDTSSVQNKIQIARSYGADTVLKTQFKKYRLNLISASDSGKFLKFKIAFNSALSTNYESRFYSVSGIELLTAGNNNATEYRVGIVYKSTLNTDGTTTIATDDIPTAKVDVKHTYYRTDYSDKGEGWSQQLSSCYFRLPKSFSFENKSYSSLQAITAEFYNYVTTPIIVTGNDKVNGYMNDYVTHKSKSAIPENFYVFQETENPNKGSGANIWSYSWSNFSYPNTGWALRRATQVDYEPIIEVDSLDWVFYDNKLDLSDYTVTQKNYRLSSSTIYNRYSTVKNTYSDDYMQRLFISEEEYNNGKFSLTGFNYGYNSHTYSRAVDPEEQDDVLGYTLKLDNTSGWQKFWGIKSSTSQDLLPIVNISLDDANNLSDEEFSKKYLINMNDVESVKREVTYYSDEQYYLLRYDCCEYFGDKVNIQTPDMNAAQSSPALMAIESAYLDFDILSFRIAQDGAPFLVETPTKKGFESSNPGKVDDEIEVPNEGNPEDVFNPIEVAPTPDPGKPDCSLFSMRYIWLIIAIASGIIIIIILIKLISLALRIENIWLKILILAVIIAAIGTACYFLYSWLWAKYIAAI